MCESVNWESDAGGAGNEYLKRKRMEAVRGEKEETQKLPKLCVKWVRGN